MWPNIACAQYGGRTFVPETKFKKCTSDKKSRLVMHRGGVQAVGLYNGLVDSVLLYIGAAVWLCNGAG